MLAGLVLGQTWHARTASSGCQVIRSRRWRRSGKQHACAAVVWSRCWKMATCASAVRALARLMFERLVAGIVTIASGHTTWASARAGKASAFLRATCLSGGQERASAYRF